MLKHPAEVARRETVPAQHRDDQRTRRSAGRRCELVDRGQQPTELMIDVTGQPELAAVDAAQ